MIFFIEYAVLVWGASGGGRLGLVDQITAQLSSLKAPEQWAQWRPVGVELNARLDAKPSVGFFFNKWKE